MGGITAETAYQWGLVDAAPVGRVLKRWVEQRSYQVDDAQGRTEAIGPIKQLSYWADVDYSLVLKVISGAKPFVGFDIADRLICLSVGPFAWYSEPELRDLYESFDLTRLDLRNPPSPECDRLREVEGLPQREAGRILGIPGATVWQMRKKRERDAVAA